MTNRLIGAASALAALFLAMGTATASSLVVNGDFSAGNSGFTSDYGFITNNNCYPETSYDIVINPNNCHNLWASFGDHTTGTGNMMAVNGATSSNLNIWSENVTVTPNTQYNFSAWVASSYPVSPAALDFSINGQQLGGDFTASTTTGLWQEFTGTWNSGASSAANLTIVDKNTDAYGNDFALDDIAMSEATATPEPAYFVVTGIGLAAMLMLRRRKAATSPARD